MSKELNPDIPDDLPKIYALLESEGELKPGKSYALPNSDDSEVYTPIYHFKPFQEDANDPCLRWVVISCKKLGNGSYSEVVSTRGLVKRTPDRQWNYKTKRAFVLKKELKEHGLFTLGREQSCSISPPLKAKYSPFVFRGHPALLLRNAGDRSLQSFLSTQFELLEDEYNGKRFVKSWQTRHFSMLERLEMAKSLCLALMSLHAEKVSTNGQDLGTLIHRDLKPENIMLKGMQPTIIDRGLARGSKEVSQWSRIVGSKLYCDSLKWDKTLEPYLDEKSDIWSLGLILMEVFGDFHRLALSDRNELAEDNANISVNLQEIVGQFGVSADERDNLVKLIRSCLKYDKDERPLLPDLVASFDQLIARRKTFLQGIKADANLGSSIIIELLKSEYADRFINSCDKVGLIDKRIQLLGNQLLLLPPKVASKLLKLSKPGCLKKRVSLQKVLDICKDEINPKTLGLAIKYGAVISDDLIKDWIKSYNPQTLTPNWIRIARVLHNHSFTKLAEAVKTYQEDNNGLAILFEQGICLQKSNPDDLPMRIQEHIRLKGRKTKLERRLRRMEEDTTLNKSLLPFFQKIKALIAPSRNAKAPLGFFLTNNETYALKVAKDLFKTYRKLLADCASGGKSSKIPAYQTLLAELEAYTTNDSPIDLATMLRQFKEYGRQLQQMGTLKLLADYSYCLQLSLREELATKLKETQVADLLARFKDPIYRQLGECLAFYCCDLPETDSLKARCRKILLSLNSLDSESIAPVCQQIRQFKEMVVMEKAARQTAELAGLQGFNSGIKLAETTSDAERLEFWKNHFTLAKQLLDLQKGIQHLPSGHVFCPKFLTVYDYWFSDFVARPRSFSFDADTLATINYFFNFISTYKPSEIDKIEKQTQDFLAGENGITLQDVVQEYRRVVTIVGAERKAAQEQEATKNVFETTYKV